MHDKQVRRRRAVLALLVGVSLILLTAYFGESPSSPLHSVQRGIVQVLSPIQEGASKALKPFRDIANSVSSTFHAKAERDRYKSQLAKVTQELAVAQQKALAYDLLAKEQGLDNSLSISARQRVGAYVISRDPTLWYATIEVDKGSADGARLNDPVIGDGALVGKVSFVGATYSIVTLITDHSMGVTAQVQDQLGDTGVLVPSVGNPNQLLLQDLQPPKPGQAGPAVGQMVVTAGFTSGKLDSLYPPGIPIGQVSGASQSDLINNGEIQVAPLADLRHLGSVEILTSPHAGTQRAQLP